VVVDVDFAGMRFRNVNFEGAKVMEAHLVNARFSGLITGLVINDVEVAPLIEAELNRRFPERAMLTPTTAADVRTAWSIIECNGRRPDRALSICRSPCCTNGWTANGRAWKPSDTGT
jgi:hypothetical protein